MHFSGGGAGHGVVGHDRYSKRMAECGEDVEEGGAFGEIDGDENLLESLMKIFRQRGAG